MEYRGEFLSPGSRSPVIPQSKFDTAGHDVAHHDESLSKEQVDEIERLLDRIGASDADDTDLPEETHEDPNIPASTVPTNKKHSRNTTALRQSQKNAPNLERELLWKAHIKDVQTYLEAKKRTTTRAILQERKHKKEVHQSQPWQRIHRSCTAPALLADMDASLSNFFIHPTDLRDFIEFRSS
ncbi:hypothetical protein ABB37_05318 [Leptomonas pyrrhocoris]|uniref:Uncharacterized protein n=1 Tax=Leptomonas pyrrhocoris TaxID=157538 RepID=A0A0M9G066_LEPPY|nr:hypothetical protein ABB37_05318 [Leptomonas pyrrhocoris]KPA79487.1 hypothetical protein ABB37_05318 [Leptomonas pyrrhocoris]|eukprot:XP_015657926.1 hypothetical protein ABB37_05318 [Leptomonas pyrrhocoris]